MKINHLKLSFAFYFILFAVFLTVSCEDNSQIVNGHEAVDLGLPSGTLWATTNVGAETPEEEGTAFAWGETTKKDTFTWHTYKLCDVTDYENYYEYKLNKYNARKSYGTVVDRLHDLLPEDDAATVLWGKDWNTPTDDDVQELVEKCHFKYEMEGDTEGYRVTGPNGNSIYFAFNHIHEADTVMTHYEGVFLWTKTVHELDDGGCFSARTFFINRAAGIADTRRYNGMSVRPVCKKRKN